MAIPITPLSRRPRWLWLLPLLSAVALGKTLLDVLRGHMAELPVVAQWAWVAWFLFVTVAFSWQATTAPVTDYDADYLYLARKTGTEQIPLASFYKLKEGNRGAWQLRYHDEQGRPRKLTIQPLGDGDDSSIHGFIDAVWQHNPQLDLPW